MEFKDSKDVIFQPSDGMLATMKTLEKKKEILKEHKKSPFLVHGVGFFIYSALFLICLPPIFMLFMKMMGNPIIAFFITGVCFLASTGVYSKITNHFLKPHTKADEYQQIYTNHIALPMLKSIDKSFTYDRNGSLIDKFPHLKDIMPSHEFEDLVCANISGINFSLAEYIDPYDEDTHDKRKNFCFVADFNKNLHSSTIICSAGFESTVSNQKHKRIKLDNEEYNKKFITYSKDEVESRYILTSTFMEKMLKINDKIIGDFYFTDNKILFYGSYVKRMKFNSFSRYSFDMFDIKTDKSIYDQTKETYENLINILSFIYELNLDSKVWK